jgi:integrase
MAALASAILPGQRAFLIIRPASFHLLQRWTQAKHITPHSLRHTMVTLALDAGVSLRDVQDAARHADPRTTRRYDRARHALDRHATYTLAAFVAEVVPSPTGENHPFPPSASPRRP